MKRFIATVFVVGLLITGSLVEAQPMTPKTPLKPAMVVKPMAIPKTAPVMAPALTAMIAVNPMVASKPPAMAVAPMSAAAPMAMAAKTETTPSKPAVKKSKDESVSEWINRLAPWFIALVIFVLGIAGWKKHLQNERAKKIITGVRDGVKSWYAHAQKTDQKWDDAVAKLLLDLSDKLIAEGEAPLTEKEKTEAKSAADANKKIIGPDQPKD